MIRVSIIIPVRESYEILRRQILYMNNILGISDPIEVVVVDHANKPKLEDSLTVEPTFNIKFIYCDNPKPWILSTLFNIGRQNADGRYLMTKGIDHMISLKWALWAETADADWQRFNRIWARIEENGRLNILKIDVNGEISKLSGEIKKSPPATCDWCSTELWDKVGGYDENYDGGRTMGLVFRRKVAKAIGVRNINKYGPDIYMHPEVSSSLRQHHLFHSFDRNV